MGSLRSSAGRLSATKYFVKLVNSSRESSFREQNAKLHNLMNEVLQEYRPSYFKLFSDIIHYWANEQPINPALWICEDNQKDKILTFKDIDVESERLSKVLVSKNFGLEPGQSVLLILPDQSFERNTLQLACLRSGLICSFHDPKHLTQNEFNKKIRKLAIDCTITNKDNLEVVRYLTSQPVRPMKKGLMVNDSSCQLLPVGWDNLMKETDSQNVQENCNVLDMPALRVLSNEDNVIEYSQYEFLFNIVRRALWLNKFGKLNLIWTKNQDEIGSLASLLIGTSIFKKETKTPTELFDICNKYQIDALLASAKDYRLSEDIQSNKISKHLQCLFSSEKVDDHVKRQWYSLTSLHIDDGMCTVAQNQLYIN